MTVIHWFRQDLRIADNPALSEASKQGEVLPVYILDLETAGSHRMGGASLWWLEKSLSSLNESLGGCLQVFEGDASKILPALAQSVQAKAVYWNRCYEPWRIQRDTGIKKSLRDQGVEVFTHNGSLLWEPWQILKPDEIPYKVFTPFYKTSLKQASPRHVLPAVKLSALVKRKKFGDYPAPRFEKHAWQKTLEDHWQMGEAAAQQRLHNFLSEGKVAVYGSARDIPAQTGTSALSPYLHYGEISPNQIWYTVKKQVDADVAEPFLRQLIWREFSYYLLYHFPELPHANFQPKFDRFPWQQDASALAAWQKGMTGYPFVDAGMRELWQTGYMHNRLRMVTGSFLVKNLLIDWREGEKWFWDCLVDADLANNSAGWQWVAGSGADAAPYFRIFNPVMQGQKFDPAGEYTKRYLPELVKLPDRYLFCPWEAPASVLKASGVQLGVDYPKPLVEMKASRERALAAYQVIKAD